MYLLITNQDITPLNLQHFCFYLVVKLLYQLILNSGWLPEAEKDGIRARLREHFYSLEWVILNFEMNRERAEKNISILLTLIGTRNYGISKPSGSYLTIGREIQGE